MIPGRTMNAPMLAVVLGGVLGLLAVVLVSCQSPSYPPPPSRPTDAAPSPGSPAVTPRTTPATPTVPVTTTPAPPTFAPLSSIRREPLVRVRVVEAGATVRIESPGGFRVGPFDPAASQAHTQHYPVGLSVSRQGDAFILRPDRGQALRWAVPALLVTPNGQTLGLGGSQFPGQISLHQAHDEDGRPLNAVDAVNHVAVETYLPGVLEKELYGSWHLEAFRAQAVAARSYALDRRHRNARRHFDLESTTRSQVYGGAATNPKAIDAVRQTRGMVLAWQGHIVPGYYSSACGGSGQDAAIAFGGDAPIPPLASHEHGACCAASNRYRWGPVVQARETLARRIAAWGAAQKPVHPVSQLRGLASVSITARSSAGRPARFTLLDMTGRSFDLGPEQFRFACNHEPPGLPRLADSEKLYSSHVDVQVTGPSITFRNGRGFGHGVGMCQWGAQHLAQRGDNLTRILAFYYPGATIDRLY